MAADSELDLAAGPSKSSSPVRTGVVLLLALAAVVAVLAVVWFRAMDGPMVATASAGGKTATVRQRERVGVTMRVYLPGGEGARITAVRANTDRGLTVVGSYLAPAESRTVLATPFDWKAGVGGAPSLRALSRTGRFSLARGAGTPVTAQLLTVVARADRPGLHRYRSVELDYRVGKRHFRKHFSVGFAACVAARTATAAQANPCR